MNEEDKKKIKRNLVALEKKLKLDDQFQRLSVQKRMFSQEMMDDIMEEDSPTLDYCMKLMLRGPKAFGRFIDALIETGQNDIVRLLAPNIDVRSFSGSNALGVSMRNVPVQELIPSTSTITHYTGDSFAETEKLYHPPRPRNSSNSLDTPMTSYGLASSMHTSTSPYVNQPALCQPVLGVEPRYSEQDEHLQHEDNGVLIFQVKPASHDFYSKKNKSMKCYPVTLSKKRGRVLIININSFDNNLYDARAGSETDVCNLDKLFQQLNFIVTLKQDVNAEQFIMEIESFAQREDHKEYSSCFVFLMSHGADLGNGHWGIVAKDGIKIDVEEIIAKFSNQKAKSLIEKPKIIVINACRGDTSDRGVAHPIPYVPEGAYKKPRLYKDGNNESADELHRAVDDMTIFKSTVPGFASHREEKYGSWLVMALCHVFAQKACDKDVYTLFKLTDEKIKSIKGSENQRQTAEIISRGMNKELFLYPGL